MPTARHYRIGISTNSKGICICSIRVEVQNSSPCLSMIRLKVGTDVRSYFQRLAHELGRNVLSYITFKLPRKINRDKGVGLKSGFTSIAASIPTACTNQLANSISVSLVDTYSVSSRATFNQPHTHLRGARSYRHCCVLHLMYELHPLPSAPIIVPSSPIVSRGESGSR